MEYNLQSIAERRSFWNTLKEKGDKSKISMEKMVSKTDDAIRAISSSHGAKKTSLSDDISLAQKAFDKNHLFAIRGHLTNFDNAMTDIVRESSELIEFGKKLASLEYNMSKCAGIFDIFKSKKKDQSFESKHEVAISDKKEGIKNFINEAHETYQIVKTIFKKLDDKRSSGDTVAYIKQLLSLKEEQVAFHAAFRKANEEYFMPLLEMRAYFDQAGKDDTGEEKVKKTLDEMKKELYEGKKDIGMSHRVEPIKYTDEPVESTISTPARWEQRDYTATPAMLPSSSTLDQHPWQAPSSQPVKISPTITQGPLSINKFEACPCESGLPWVACHGTDVDKINQIMRNKNVSRDKAEVEYYMMINMQTGGDARRVADREQKERDRVRRETARRSSEAWGPPKMPPSALPGSHMPTPSAIEQARKAKELKARLTNREASRSADRIKLARLLIRKY